MANTFYLIQTVTVSAAGGNASIEFLSIPQTYTDLMLVYSGRSSRAAGGDDLYVRFNGLSTNLSSRVLYGTGSSATAFGDASVAYVGYLSGDTSTASVFANGSIYIPNYALSTNIKSVSGDAVSENNATAATQYIASGLWSNTSAITQINIYALNGNLKQYSSASLYGISKN